MTIQPLELYSHATILYKHTTTVQSQPLTGTKADNNTDKLKHSHHARAQNKHKVLSPPRGKVAATRGGVGARPRDGATGPQPSAGGSKGALRRKGRPKKAAV
jgi:hypothetical protein